MSTDASGSAHERTAAADAGKPVGERAGDHASGPVAKPGTALKKPHPRHDPSAPRRTLQPYQFLAEQPVDPEWAEYVEDVLARRCYYCDFTNLSEATDCEQCGRPLDIVCPECGSVNPNNPEAPTCLDCDALLWEVPVEPFEQYRVESQDTGAPDSYVIAPIIGGLVLIVIVIAALSKDDPSGVLIWLVLAPIALIALVLYLYFRSGHQSSTNNDT